MTFISNNYQLLYNLFKFVKENGGYSNGNFQFNLVILNNGFIKFINQNPKLKKVSDAKSTFCQFLSHFYLYEEKKYTDPEEICIFDDSFINEIPIIYCPLDSKEIDTKLRESFKYDMVILRGFYETFNINERLFSITEIQKEFQNNKANLEIHEQTMIGFSKKEKLANHNSKEPKSYTMSLDFMPKMKNEFEKKINPIIFGNLKENALKYANYSSIKNSFTTITNENSLFGGKEQEYRFITFNLNHGPQENIWYGINSCEATKLRKLVKNQHNVDIFSKEADWFCETDFFSKNRINVTYGKMQKGDIILIGHGCLYWYN